METTAPGFTRFVVARRSIDLPAVQAAQRAVTDQLSAWLGGEWITVTLTRELEALRVHSDGQPIDGQRSSLTGRWLALGDVILTATQYEASRVLLRRFTHVADVVLRTGTTLNIGIAGPLRSHPHPGGGWQAERVSDTPAPLYRPAADASGVPNVWVNRAGRA